MVAFHRFELALLRVMISHSTDFEPDPTHPCLTGLRQALLERWRQLCVLSLAPPPPSVARVISGATRPEDIVKSFQFIGEQSGLRNEIVELTGWAFPKEETLSEARVIARLHQVPQVDPDVAVALINSVRSNPRGRRVSGREIAIRAFERRLADVQAWPWSKLAAKDCPCGRANHNHHCQESIRKEVGHLKRVLKKYGIILREAPRK